MRMNQLFSQFRAKVAAMSMRMRLAFIAMLTLVIVVPGAVWAADYSLTPAQPVVDAGRELKFSGSGFITGELVVTWATAPDQSVLSGPQASASGSTGQIEFTFKLPSNALNGRWAMTAYGLDSQYPVITYFDVNGREPTTTAPQAAVEPSVGSAGTQFAFAAFGFRARERVSYWVTAPGGQVFAAYPEAASATKDGRVDVNWRAPSNAQPGIWVMTIQGIKSGIARGVPFEIQ